MHSHMISGGGGIRLHVVESGNPRGQAILFIHGISQSWLAWSRQMSSDLSADFRLIAMDLRGHGLSDKPDTGYDDSRLWADDVHRVIEGLAVEQPVLCGWSYGPLVILDYLRHYGEDAIRGVHFVGGVTQLGSDAALSVLTAGFLGLVPGFFSADAHESVRSLSGLLRLCFASELSAQDRYLMLGYNVAVPPYVRQGMFSRSFDNHDLLPRLRRPALIMYGTEDAVVKPPQVIEQQMARIAGAQISLLAGAGHGCFWDDPGAFNRRLRAFAGPAVSIAR